MDAIDSSQKPLRVGLPKGRFLAASQRVLQRLGVNSASDPRVMAHDVPHLGVRVHMLKARDLAWLVRDGHLDLGVTSDDWVCESQGDVDRFGRLCWCHTWLCVIAAAGYSLPARNSSRPVRLVTEYPRIAAAYTRRQGWANCDILTVCGSAEACLPQLGDLVIDCVETGDTIKANGLEIVEVILPTDTHLIGSPTLPRQNRSGWGRLQPVLDAVLSASQHHASTPPFLASTTVPLVGAAPP